MVGLKTRPLTINDMVELKTQQSDAVRLGGGNAAGRKGGK